MGGKLKFAWHSGDTQLTKGSPYHYNWYSTKGKESVIIELRDLLKNLGLIESSDLQVVEKLLEQEHEHGESPSNVRLEIYLNEPDNALAHKKMKTIKGILEDNSGDKSEWERLRPWRELMRSLGPLRPQGGGKRRRKTKRRRTKRRKSNKTRKRKSRRTRKRRSHR